MRVRGAVARAKRALLPGGADGNERLTVAVGIVLLLVLAAEGVTILRIGQLLTPHEFIGMLLIPPVALKLVSTGWRFLGYYRRQDEYLLKGPPRLLLRVLVAPVLVLSTLIVFGTGSPCSRVTSGRGSWSGCTRRRS